MSVVVPVYRNSETLVSLHSRIRAVLEGLGLGYEILFVNDACPAGSLAVLREIAENDAKAAVLVLKENLGQHTAVLAGLRHALGKRIVTMDADLQDPPEAIPELLAKMNEGYAAVFAGRRGRYESPVRLFTSGIFKWSLCLLSGVPADAGMFLVMDRRLSELLLSFYAPRPFLVAMIGCAGLPNASIPVARDRRSIGRSAYSPWMRLKTGGLALFWTLVWKCFPAAQRLGKGMDFPVDAYIGRRFNGATVKL